MKLPENWVKIVKEGGKLSDSRIVNTKNDGVGIIFKGTDGKEARVDIKADKFNEDDVILSFNNGERFTASFRTVFEVFLELPGWIIDMLLAGKTAEEINRDHRGRALGNKLGLVESRPWNGGKTDADRNEHEILIDDFKKALKDKIIDIMCPGLPYPEKSKYESRFRVCLDVNKSLVNTVWEDDVESVSFSYGAYYEATPTIGDRKNVNKKTLVSEVEKFAKDFAEKHEQIVQIDSYSTAGEWLQISFVPKSKRGERLGKTLGIVESKFLSYDEFCLNEAEVPRGTYEALRVDACKKLAKYLEENGASGSIEQWYKKLSMSFMARSTLLVFLYEEFYEDCINYASYHSKPSLQAEKLKEKFLEIANEFAENRKLNCDFEIKPHTIGDCLLFYLWTHSGRGAFMGRKIGIV